MSANPVYVTLAQSAGSPIWLTALDLAVSSDGATTAADAFQKTWNKFSGPANVKSWDGRPLYYYPSGAGFTACETNSQRLLTSTTGAGQCGSFASLLRAALDVNGISSNLTGAGTADGSLMIVKNWGFGPSSLTDAPGWPYRMFLNVGNDFMIPARDSYGDLANNPGLSGQNSATPSEKVFGSHYFVKVDASVAPPGSGPYFDPSYGVWYSTEGDFEAKAIEGYAAKVGDNADSPNFHARKPGSDATIRFIVY